MEHFNRGVRQAARKLLHRAGRDEPLVLRTNQEDRLANCRKSIAVIERGQKPTAARRVANGSPPRVLNKKHPAGLIERGKGALPVGVLDCVPERDPGQRSRNKPSQAAQESLRRAQSAVSKPGLQDGPVDSRGASLIAASATALPNDVANNEKAESP